MTDKREGKTIVPMLVIGAGIATLGVCSILLVRSVINSEAVLGLGPRAAPAAPQKV